MSQASIVKITSCDDCSISEVEYEAKSVFNWNQGGLVYVVDFDRHIGYKLNVYVDYVVEGPDSFPVHKTAIFPLSNDEQSGINELFFIDDEIRRFTESFNNSQNGFGAFTSDLDEVMAMQNQTGSALRGGSITFNETPPDLSENFNAHEFMSSSSLRKALYRDHFFVHLDAYIATAFNAATNALDLGFLSLKDINLGFQLNFPDGSHILIFPDLNTATFRYVENSAYDSDDNLIPSPGGAVITGNYQFSSLDNYLSMKEYLRIHFGATFPEPHHHCRSLSMTCEVNTDGTRYSCVINSCEL